MWGHSLECGGSWHMPTHTHTPVHRLYSCSSRMLYYLNHRYRLHKFTQVKYYVQFYRLRWLLYHSISPFCLHSIVSTMNNCYNGVLFSLSSFILASAVASGLCTVHGHGHIVLLWTVWLYCCYLIVWPYPCEWARVRVSACDCLTKKALFGVPAHWID